MPAAIVIGAQWGDEGKGKITDHLAERAHLVMRYQGGNNAGHTVMVGETVLKLHQIPSGITRPAVAVVLGHGMVINPLPSSKSSTPCAAWASLRTISTSAPAPTW